MTEEIINAFVGRERHCYICNKEFIITPEWVYKRGKGDGMKYFCSWRCLQSYEENNMTKAQKNEAMRQMLTEGKSIREIMDKLDIDSRRVYYWKQKMQKEGLL